MARSQDSRSTRPAERKTVGARRRAGRMLAIGLAAFLAGGLLLAEHRALGERDAFRLAAGWTPVPSGAALQRLSFGYDRVVGDILWLKTLQYYGKQRLARAPMPRFKEYIDATVALDPHFLAPYIFGGLVLVQDLDRPAEAVDLLLRGIEANPDRWELPFELGFLLYIDLDDPLRAGRYFEVAASREGSPEMAKRFAAWTYARGGNRDDTRRICEEIIHFSGDAGMRAFAEEALAKIRIEEDLDTIRAAIAAYRDREGAPPPSLEALTASGDLESIPVEPSGGFYAYRSDTGDVGSSERIQAALDRHFKEIEDSVARYKAKWGRNPENLESLVTEGLVAELRTIFGYRFAFDPESGRIWAVDVGRT
jgi:tetratricopeptide (TPR) repeat protein